MEQPRTSDITKTGIHATIADLRLCNSAQSEVIANLEEYERTVLGLGLHEAETAAAGYSGGYVAELEYLHCRRHALDALISAVERYSVLAEGIIVETEAIAG